MPSNAISAQGAELRFSTVVSGTSKSFTKVADVEDITGPSESNNFVEVTNHDSSAVERLPTLNDPGTVDVTVSFQPDEPTHNAGSSGLRGLLRNQSERTFRLVWPTTGTDIDEFNAWVSDFEPTAPTNDVLRADLSLQVSGSVSRLTSTST